MTIAYNAYCLFLLSLLIIVHFRILYFFFRCYHYLVNKDVYTRTEKWSTAINTSTHQRTNPFRWTQNVSNLVFLSIFLISCMSASDSSKSKTWRHSIKRMFLPNRATSHLIALFLVISNAITESVNVMEKYDKIPRRVNILHLPRKPAVLKSWLMQVNYTHIIS